MPVTVLCGPRKAEKLGAKQAAMKQDDWSKVCLYMSYLAKEDGECVACSFFSRS